MQSTSCELPGWMNHKLESRLLGRNINNLRYADDTTLMKESKEELKSLWMRVKEESEKIQHSKKLRSWHPVPSLHNKQMREKVEKVTDFIFWGSKITVDGDCSHENKTLAPWRKSHDKQT